jgi:hypothetical protein
MEQPAIITSEDVLEALRLWNGGNPPKWPLARLRLSLMAGSDEQAHGTLAGNGPAARNRAVLSRSMEVLQGQDPEAHDLLRQRFEHRRDVMDVTNHLNLSKQGLLYRQRQAVNQLTDILVVQERAASQEWSRKVVSRLGLPSYERLVGIEEPYSALTGALLAEDTHFLAAVDGLGGMGKTALADYVVRSL